MSLFLVSVTYQKTKKRKGFDAVDRFTRKVGTFPVSADDHESAARAVLQWLFADCEGWCEIREYPQTARLAVTKYDKAARGIMWPTNGDGAIVFRVCEAGGEFRIAK